MTNTKKKNFLRAFTCFALLFAIVFTCITSIPAYAAGTENWGAGQGPEENIRVTDCNLTPVKTITSNGTLTIHYLTLPCKPGYTHCICGDKEPWNYPPVRATVQIRNANTGAVLSTSTASELQDQTVSYYVTAGMKVQIFFDVSTAPGYSAPGPYRKAHFSYYYTIT